MTDPPAEWLLPRVLSVFYNPWPVHQPSSRDHGVIFFPPIPHHARRLVRIVCGGFPPIRAHAFRYKTMGCLTCRISWCPFCSTVSDHVFTRSSLLVYSQGFAISRDEYIIRDLTFCDWTGRPEPEWIVRPGRCMVCRLNRMWQSTTAMNSIPTIRWGTISPAGVNNISPPNGGGWVSSRSMVCIDCSKSHGFRTKSSSWKVRAAGTWPVFPQPPSMSWPPTIMAVIGARIIATGNAVAGSGTIIVRAYGPVKWVVGYVDR